MTPKEKNKKNLNEAIQKLHDSDRDILPLQILDLNNLDESERIKYLLLVECRVIFKGSELSVTDFAKALNENRTTVSMCLALKYQEFSLDKICHIYSVSCNRFNKKNKILSILNK
jgi:predicted XRE-type DNA-binding protein